MTVVRKYSEKFKNNILKISKRIQNFHKGLEYPTIVLKIRINIIYPYIRALN